MSVTRQGNSIVMTADADAVTGIFYVIGMTLQVTGSAAGQRLRVTDTAGSIIADYIVTAATDNADLLNGREGVFYHGILVEDFPSGTGVLTTVIG